MKNPPPGWLRETRSNIKTRNNQLVKNAQTEEVPISPMFKFTKSPKSNDQHLVMNLTHKGFVDFVKQYNSGVSRSKSSSKLPAYKGIYNPFKKDVDLQKYSTNFQVKALQARTEGFFGLSIFQILIS